MSLKKNAGRGALAVAVLALALCAGMAAQIPAQDNAPPSDAFSFPVEGDFSGLGWSQAFFAMHDFFSRTYAFGDWKKIPWDRMAAYYGQKIVAAEASGDRDAYRIAMVEYLKEIPDGHLKITANTDDLRERFIGGSYGLGLAELDDGSIVAAAVRADGPAGKAGLPAGARILSWNGVPTEKALLAADIRWFKNAATLDDLELERLQAITRAPVGRHATVVFEPPSADPAASLAAAATGGRNFTVELVAQHDDFADLGLFDIAPIPLTDELHRNVVWKILDGDIGYLRIYHVIHFDDITKYPTEVSDAVVEALKAFKAAGVTSLVLDLRGNRGGSDQVAADISGFFASEEAFYERTAWYNASSGHFDLAYSDLFAQTFELSDRALWVVPREPHFEGEIAVLVNPATISSGEGLAMAIGRLPNAKVLGFYGTHGSFGLIPWPIAMPEDFTFEYPIGRSLDASGRIQIDADASGSGGIQPSIRVPRTWETMAAFASGTDVELEYARRWLISH
ncbi:MAG TPA: S41 family peptidase [candidate division Zixibacteria bacterium]|nr:S41 family peptidase [candidate division Zixibacteria bacterium]